MSNDPLRQLKTYESQWEGRFQSPAWYLSVVPELQAFTKSLDAERRDIQEACKAELYSFFEDRLRTNRICLGAGYQGDVERKPVDMVIIHHTSMRPGLTPERLSAVELIRLYAPYFADPKSECDATLKGQPISSGHVRAGKQVFWPYHWIVRGDGRAERLLRDSEIGWHAGNWDVNCRSIAIVLDNDYEERRPSANELRAVASIILTHYRRVPITGIVGHREVNQKTTCPSELFLNGRAESPGWKSELVSLVMQ